MNYFVIDPDLAKHAYEQRLQDAAHAQLCAELEAQRPLWLDGLRQRLGEQLIALGMRLKAQPNIELA